jgi:hypothetical protein
MWSWTGLNQFNRTARAPVYRTTSEVVYDPLSAREFDIYYGTSLQVTTVTVPINTSYGYGDGDGLASKSDRLPVLKREVAITQGNAEGPGSSSYIEGFHIVKADKDHGAYFVVTPLKGLTSEGPRKVLRMFVSRERFEQISDPTEMAIDEATGRVVIWVWDRNALETKIFIGDLV